MKFALSEDQGALRSAVKRLLEAKASLEQTRAEDVDPRDLQSTWAALIEMGAAGVDVPDHRGGTGMSAVELAVVMEQAGSVLYPGPLLASTGLAAGLLDGDDERSLALSAALAEGKVVVAAVPDVPADWSGGVISARATAEDTSWRISGRKVGILQPDLADFFVVAAQTVAGVGLFAVDPGAVSVAIESGLNTGRRIGSIELQNAAAELIVDDAAERIEFAWLRAATALAAESVGAARGALERTRDYVSTREQFGQPVGSFQAVKHRLADLLVEIELATSATYLAACHLAAGDVSAARASAPLAVHAATTALAKAGADAVQLHGGIGFTWESSCHWYVTWAQTSRVLLGTQDAHLQRVFRQAALAS